MSSSTGKRFLLRSEINSFHYLYQDAEYLMSAARLPEIKGTFQETRIARSALLLYALSLEALINRALDKFVPTPLHDFVIAREEKFSTVEKWQLLPLLAAQPSIQIDLGTYPWSHMAELFQLRNDYVHPKHDRMAYYEAVTQSKWKHIDWKSIPEECGLKEKDLVYRQTRLPKDPYGFGLLHLEMVKRVVDDSVQALDSVLSGAVLKDGWATKDDMKLFFPVGAKIDDIPLE
jgi:hypothetical protein